MNAIIKNTKKITRQIEKITKTDMAYVAKGGFWIISGKIVLVIVSIATLAAFANLVSQETYGTYQFIISVVGVLAIFALPGIRISLIRSIAQGNEGSLLKAFQTKLTWSLIGSAGILGVSGWYFINENILLSVAFLIAGIFFPLRLSTPIFLEFWQGKKRFDIQALYQILSDSGIAIVVITTLFLTNNLWIILLSFFASTALFYGTFLIYTLRKTKNKITDENFITFGKSLTLMSVAEKTANYLDRIILWKILGPIQVAIYSFSILPIQKLRDFNVIQKLALPKLSESGVHGAKQKKSIFRKFLLLFLGTIPLAGALALVAPYVYQFLFPQYMESVIYFQVLCIWIALMPFTLLDASLIAEMKTKFLYTEKLVAPLVKIALFLALAPIYGIWGIVFAIIFAEILRGGMLTYFFWKM